MNTKIKHDINGDLAAMKMAVNLLISKNQERVSVTENKEVFYLMLEKIEKLNINFKLLINEE